MFEEEYFKDRNHELEPKHEFEVKRWIQYFSLEPEDIVFVHGCGTGQRLHWFLELGMNAWGMDVSQHAIINAYGKARGKVSDYIPTNKDWYDLVVSVDVLEHIEDSILVPSMIKLSQLSLKAVYGITYKEHHNYPKDPTHINGKSREEWKEFLLRYYSKVYDAPNDFAVEPTTFFICYR